MKKASKLTALILALVLAAGTLTGCLEILVATAIGVGSSLAVAGATEAVVAGVHAGTTNKAEAAANRKATLNEHMRGLKQYNPFSNEVEDRLTRRTSELAEGTPVDVTPYLFHEDSFAVMNDEIWYNRSVLVLKRKFGGETETFSAWEVDMAVTYEINKQPYQADLTYVYLGWLKAGAINNAKSSKEVDKYLAAKHGVNAKDIKKMKRITNEPRKGEKSITTQYRFVSNEFVHEREPGYYMFDVDVEYQNDWYIFKKLTTDDFSIFTKVYRSYLQTVEAATFDVQLQIWYDAVEYSDFDTPLPRVNFVKVVKY